MSRGLRAWVGALLALGCLTALAEPQEDAWAALRSGQAALLLRNANAPGAGDPAGFQLQDCRTQRNLDAQGRREAQQLGQLLRRHWVEGPRIYAGRWCRTQETALELGLGAVETLDALDYFDGDLAAAKRLRQRVSQLPRGLPLVLVTHGVNIGVLAGITPVPGEAVIVAMPIGEPPRVLARVPAPH